MIDMHSHIIPGIDDGSKNIEETFNMIKEAKEAGFTDIIMTSHYITHYYEPTTEEINSWKDKLQEIINSKKIGINLHTGMEIYISNQLVDLIKDQKILTLGNSNYMLIELPLRSTVNFLDHTLFLLESMSIKPIIAHPERYKCVQDNPKIIENYIEKGALMQCNFGSILGLYGRKAKKAFKTMLKKNQVHFLGSDCHRPNSIYTKIRKAVEKIKKIIGEDEFNKIAVRNPKKVLANAQWENE